MTRVVCNGGGAKTVVCPPARVRSPEQEACGAEDLITGHMALGSVSGDVSLLVRYARVSLEIWLEIWLASGTDMWAWRLLSAGAPEALVPEGRRAHGHNS